MFVHQLIGSYAVATNGAVNLPLRSLLPRHSLQALQVRCTAVWTAATGGGNATLTSAQYDAVVTSMVSRLRLFGGSLGEPINVSTTNLRTVHQLATGVDVVGYQPSTGTAAQSLSLANSATATVTIDITIPFTQIQASADLDWAAPSTDQIAAEGALELTFGPLGAISVTGTTATITASSLTANLTAVLADTHAPYLAPLQVIREQSISQNVQNFEAALYLDFFDTRPVIGSGTYVPIYSIEKDGNTVIQNVTAEDLYLNWRKNSMPAGGYDVGTRAEPIMFHSKAFNSEDLKPAYSAFTVRTVTAFVAGTIVYRALRGVTPEQEQRLAAALGYSSYRAPIMPVLDKSGNDNVFGKIAPFFPRYILPQ